MLPIRSKVLAGPDSRTTDSGAKEKQGANENSTLKSRQSAPSSPRTALDTLPTTDIDNLSITSSKNYSESACTVVFQTVELLTLILQWCPFQTILCCGMRVNKTWKAIIDTDKVLQQDLFFRSWEHDDYLGVWGEVNPCLNRLCFPRDEIREIEFYTTEIPTAIPENDSDDEDFAGNYWCECEDIDILVEFDWRKVEKDERFMRKEASWRRMLPMQRTNRYLENSLVYRLGNFCDGSSFHEMDPEGKGYKMTLGDLHEHALYFESDKYYHKGYNIRTFIHSSNKYTFLTQTFVESDWRV